VRRAREDSNRDALTGLSNRRAFDQALAACLAAPADAGPTLAAGAQAARTAIAVARSSAATQTHRAWLLMADVDRFGRINEAYGRDFGDQVLKAVAEALHTLVPAGATLARVDGGAFGLLASGLDAAAALVLADRLRAHVGSTRIRYPGREADERVTLSVGLARARDGEAPHAIMARAGAALKQAKEGGRDRVISAG
jgi:diguanylate cyclase